MAKNMPPACFLNATTFHILFGHTKRIWPSETNNTSFAPAGHLPLKGKALKARLITKTAGRKVPLFFYLLFNLLLNGDHIVVNGLAAVYDAVFGIGEGLCKICEGLLSAFFINILTVV